MNERMGTWSPARMRLAAVAVLAAIATGSLLASLGGSGAHFFGATVYVIVTVVALFFPAAITGQVIGGQVLVGALLIGSEAPAALALMPAIGSVVISAELLAVVARLDSPIPRAPHGALLRAGLAAAIGGGVFGVVALLSGLPGPTGLLAIGLASGACVVLASRLVRD